MRKQKIVHDNKTYIGHIEDINFEEKILYFVKENEPASSYYFNFGDIKSIDVVSETDMEEIDTSIAYEKQRKRTKADEMNGWTPEYHQGYTDGMTHSADLIKNM